MSQIKPMLVVSLALCMYLTVTAQTYGQQPYGQQPYGQQQYNNNGGNNYYQQRSNSYNKDPSCKPMNLGCVSVTSLSDVGFYSNTISNSPKMTNEKCFEYCHTVNREYIFSFTFNGTNCGCLFYDELNIYVPATGCRIACSGNADSCGSPTLDAVTLTALPSQCVANELNTITILNSQFYKYQTCKPRLNFKCISFPTANSPFNETTTSTYLQGYPYMTNDYCSAICGFDGFLLSGTFNGTNCDCIYDTDNLDTSSSNCNTPCAGDNKFFCGGGVNFMSVSTTVTRCIPISIF